MPSAFTHYRFACAVQDKLHDNLKKITEKNRDLYLIGAHGPDILFYYKALKKNEVNSLGSEIHLRPAASFLKNAEKIILESADKECAVSYIAGFITHFVLDSSCHGYIAEKVKHGGVSHAQIETEFDCKLMRDCKTDPLRHNPTSHIAINDKACGIIAPFFGLDAKIVKKALIHMKKINGLFATRCVLMRGIIKLALKLTGNYEKYRGLLPNPRPDPRCEENNKALTEIFEKNITTATEIIEDYMIGIEQNLPLNSLFDRNFE